MKLGITDEQKQINDIAERIIGRRHRLRLTQEQMAKQIGKARNTYSDMEKKPGRIALEDLIAILHELGLDMCITEQQIM